jgi:hypothetical protein
VIESGCLHDLRWIYILVAREEKIGVYIVIALIALQADHCVGICDLMLYTWLRMKLSDARQPRDTCPIWWKLL